MREFKSILYASHSTADETEGLKQALSLARNNDAALRVLVVCPAFPKHLEEFQEKHEAALLERARESVAKTLEELDLSEDRLEMKVELVADEKPAVRIIREVLRERHDLLIKEAELPGRGEGFWAIDMTLLRKCPCPVWLSRPIERHREEIRVAVAVDPQPRDDEGRALAVSLIRTARSLAAELQRRSRRDRVHRLSARVLPPPQPVGKRGGVRGGGGDRAWGRDEPKVARCASRGGRH